MSNVADYPLLVFVGSFLALWLSAQIGASVLRRRRSLADEAREDFSVILAATLTLLGLIIGFSFSMATNRYIRADLLPTVDAAKVRALIRNYVDQRVLFYTTRDDQELRQINARTAQLQSELWAAVQAPAAAQPTPLVALAVSGMNDVLNSQGYTQAAGWNRIPFAAWGLMLVIAVCCDVLVGYGARTPGTERILLLVLPLVVSISFLLIATLTAHAAASFKWLRKIWYVSPNLCVRNSRNRPTIRVNRGCWMAPRRIALASFRPRPRRRVHALRGS
jgi:hypothetical protein